MLSTMSSADSEINRDSIGKVDGFELQKEKKMQQNNS